MRSALVSGTGIISAAMLFGASPALAADCRALGGKTIGSALVVKTNEVKPPFTTTMSARPATATVPFCRVRGLLRPTAKSEIFFEVWLPAPESWNGKYQGNAPGGYVGNMFYEMSARGLRKGYATSTTDDGHVGANTLEWAIGHPEAARPARKRTQSL